MLCNTEDYEFSRSRRSDTDVTDEPSVHDVILRHRGRADLHKVALRRGSSCEHSVSPQSVEECGNGERHALPEGSVVGFEYDPVGIRLDTLLRRETYSSLSSVAARLPRRGLSAGRRSR